MALRPARLPGTAVRDGIPTSRRPLGRATSSSSSLCPPPPAPPRATTATCSGTRSSLEPYGVTARQPATTSSTASSSPMFAGACAAQDPPDAGGERLGPYTGGFRAASRKAFIRNVVRNPVLGGLSSLVPADAAECARVGPEPRAGSRKPARIVRQLVERARGRCSGNQVQAPRQRLGHQRRLWLPLETLGSIRSSGLQGET